MLKEESAKMQDICPENLTFLKAEREQQCPRLLIRHSPDYEKVTTRSNHPRVGYHLAFLCTKTRC